jgi:hypothetical protein
LKAQFRFAGIAQIVNSIENNFFIYYSFRLARASFAQGLLPEQAAARHWSSGGSKALRKSWRAL